MKKCSFCLIFFPPGTWPRRTHQIRENDTVAIWGCGPVGQFTIASAFMLGAARVIAIDRLPERLEMARSIGAITVDYSAEDVSVLTALKDLTVGIGPDSCIDAVGLEAHSAELQGIYDRVKTALMLETDRPSVLRQAIQAVRKGGTVSIPGVYGGLLDKVPFGAGQTNMHNYMKPLLERIEKRQIDPSYSHRITLEQAPEMYKVWRDKKENVTKIVIDPWAA